MNRLRMSIDETYYSHNITDDVNIFVESFDPSQFNMIKMTYPDFQFTKIGSITTNSEEQLNTWIDEKIGDIND